MSRRGSQAVMIFAIAISLAGALFLVGAKGSKAAPAKRDVIVARVGKERIYLAALIQATAPYKYRLEQEGYDFGSARGQPLYQQLQESVLNNLIVRTLLAQGVAEQKITLGPAEFEEGFRKELKERKQTEAELRAELKKYGWTMRIFQADLKRRLLEEKFIARLAKGKSGTERDEAVNRWLAERATSLGVEVYFQTGASGGDILKEAEEEALKYYRSKYGADKELSAKAANYGCHIQVDIIKKGKVIKSFGYGGGQVYEL